MATLDFTIPSKPEDLIAERCPYDLRVHELKDCSHESAKGFAQGVVYELCSDSSLGILQQNTFDNVYSLISGLVHLDSLIKRRLIDSLCSNLSVLGVSANGTLALEDGDERNEGAASHASAMKAYSFFLWWIFSQCEEEDKKMAQSAVSSTNGTSRATKKKKADSGDQWEWDPQREKILRCIASCSDVDLWKLFRPKNVDSRLLERWVQIAVLALESHQAMKSKATKSAAFLIISTAVHKYQQLDAVTGALIDILNKYEHSATVLAELSEYANTNFNDSRLGMEVLREVALVNPLEYDQQQRDDAAGIRNVSSFVQELTERLPKAVSQHISILIPHLGGKAHPLRSAIVTVIGVLIQTAYADPPEETADAQGAMVRLRTKQHLLDTLIERARDQSAFTRARVMQTWSSLAVSRSIDMGHWLCVTEIAIGRLEDKSPYVRKNALLLLSSLLSFNPFAPHLPEDKFVATLEEYKRKLKEVEPADPDSKPALNPISEETDIDIDAEARQAEAVQREVQAATSGDQAMEELGSSQESDGRETVSEQIQPPSAEVVQLRTTVACMDAAVGFIKAMQGGLATVTQLLASSNLSDVTEAISLLICYDKFCIKGSKETLRQMLPLIFTREQGVKEAVLGAIDELCIGDLTPKDAAKRLMELMQGSTLGELSSLEEVVAQMLIHQPPLLKPPVIQAIWQCLGSSQSLLDSKVADLECGCALISMIAAKQPETVVDNLSLLLKIMQSHMSKPAVVRSICTALQRVDASSFSPETQMAVTRLLVAVTLDVTMPSSGWFSAAEAAIKALYALHSAPTAVGLFILRRSAASVFEGGASSTNGLARFFFVLGQVAIQLLVHIEHVTSSVRRARLAKEKAASEAQSQPSAAQEGGVKAEDDISAQVGAGSVAADAELDALKETAEAQILNAANLIGQYGKIVMSFCHNRPLMAADYNLRTSALLALTKLMALDPSFCDLNLQLVFTFLQNKYPNVLEPWTHNIYRPLSDPDKGVVKNSLMVLTHLILNDMMKVKGHVARLALCLQDSDFRVASLAQLFFHELSNKAYKGTTPVYNLLPDILSNLSSEATLTQRAFQGIMRHLLQYIGKEKHADSLVDKLCARFEATDDLVQWRNLAFCIGQLNYSEKGFRRLMELVAVYQRALYDEEVVETFKAIISKAKKLPKLQPEFKTDVEAFEVKLSEVAAARKAEHATEEAARRQLSSAEDEIEKVSDIRVEEEISIPLDLDQGEAQCSRDQAKDTAAHSPEAQSESTMGGAKSGIAASPADLPVQVKQEDISQQFASMELRESNARDVSTSIELHSAMEDQSVIRQSRSPSVGMQSALQNDSRRNSSYSSVYGTPAASEASMAKSVSKAVEGTRQGSGRSTSISSRQRSTDGFADENLPQQRRSSRAVVKSEPQ